MELEIVLQMGFTIFTIRYIFSYFPFLNFKLFFISTVDSIVIFVSRPHHDVINNAFVRLTKFTPYPVP